MDTQRLRGLLEAATKGEWSVDHIDSDGTYGGGPDARSGFKVWALIDDKGNALLDTMNRDSAVSEVREEYDEDGGSAWEAKGLADLECIAAMHAELPALLTRIDAAEAFVNMVKWAVKHEGECLGDHPELLEAAKAAIDGWQSARSVMEK